MEEPSTELVSCCEPAIRRRPPSPPPGHDRRSDLNFDNTAFETMGRVDPCPETCSVSNSVSTPEIGDKNLLGLDLGTKTGYGCRRRDGRVIYGTEVFTPKKTWTPGQRGLRFQ